MSASAVPPGVDPTKPSPARVYDYLLGGTENFEADRRLADQMIEHAPDTHDAVWANRGFLQRATTWMAGAGGIEQFIDIGAGLPTRNNTHEAARKATPNPHVVYADNDPMVVAHGQALLEHQDGTAFIAGDFLDPEGILGHEAVRDLIDFTKPVGVLMVALLHFVPDSDDPAGLVRRYLDAVPTGSCLAMSHATGDRMSDEHTARGKRIYRAASDRISPRTRDEVRAFFDGLEIVPPYEGAAPEITYVSLWGAEDPDLADSDGGRMGYCAVGRKP